MVVHFYKSPPTNWFRADFFKDVSLSFQSDKWDLYSDDMDQDAMADGGLDDMMEAELANMAERDAEVEMVMAEFDAGDAGGMDNAD